VAHCNTLIASLTKLSYFQLFFTKQDNVRTNTESVQCRDFFFERAIGYLAPKYTEVTINTSLTSSVTWPFDSPYAILQVFYCNRVCISSRFRDNRPQTFWGHDLDLTRSRDVIDQVTNRFALGYLLLVVHCNKSLSKRFWDICIYRYLGHDLDLLRSRDVIDQVNNRFNDPKMNNRFAICYFLLVVHCNQISISKRLWLIATRQAPH